MSAADARLRALEASLERRFRTVRSRVTVGALDLELLHPASAEDLIDERDFERDERLPYWADLWPSSRVLGAVVAAEDGRGSRLLELGCGAGLVACCAAAAGYDVTASDYYDAALEFTAVNCWRTTGRAPRTIPIDWRALPPELGRFDRVVASDVLYERPYGELVARAVAAALAPRGTATVADPGRVGRETFVAEASRLGLLVDESRQEPFVEGEIRQTITLLGLRWPAEPLPDGQPP